MRHRDSQRRVPIDGHAVFITTTTCGRYPYFANPIFAELFVRDLHFAKELKEFELFGYAVLLDHVHFLFRPIGNSSYSDVVGALKRNVGRDINCLIDGSPFIRNLMEGDDSNRRLQRNFEVTKKNLSHILFQAYEQHFHDLENLRKRSKYLNSLHIPRFRWQKSFRDHVIRNGEDFHKHLRYIYGNAVKHVLTTEPEEWKWMWAIGLPEPTF